MYILVYRQMIGVILTKFQKSQIYSDKWNKFCINLIAMYQDVKTIVHLAVKSEIIPCCKNIACKNEGGRMLREGEE